MGARWIRRVAVIVTMAMVPDVLFATQPEPKWLTTTGAAAIVEVTMKTGESFDAIWMGRDGDRAVFERLHPDEIVSVPIESVRAVRMLRGHSASVAYGALGVAAGFWGAFLVFKWFFVPRT
jgi:hypothetical protein